VTRSESSQSSFCNAILYDSREISDLQAYRLWYGQRSVRRQIYSFPEGREIAMLPWVSVHLQQN